jgi:drug/metabolite transporter (DMT)-like permease
VHDDRKHLIWVVLALLSGVFFGSAVTVSRFAYDAGASGIVVAMSRTIIVVAVLAVVIKLAGSGWSLPRALAPLVIFNGLLMTASTYGIIGAVEFISVGLASLLFFTFPVIIAVIVMTLRIEQFGLAKLLAIGLAFIGLSAMLESSIGNVDWRGTVFALVAAVATAINAVLIARFFQRVSILVLMFHLSVVTLIVLTLIAVSIVDLRVPNDAPGWGGVVGVAVFQALGMPMFYSAVARIGALKASMAINVQPVTAIFEAWALFGEVLSILQAVGGALVLAAIALMQWIDLRKRRDPTAP